MCFLWQSEIYLWYFLPGTACFYSGAFSCRPSVSPEPSAARMSLLILWLSPTGYCCRERQNSLFVLEYASSRVWFLYRNYYRLKERQLWDRGFHRNSSLQVAWVFDLVWSKTRMRCGLLYYLWLLGCVLIQSTRTHTISYVCTWGLLLLIFHWNTYFCLLYTSPSPRD